VDALLLLYREMASGIEVNRNVVARRLAEEVPFLAMEEVMMAAVSAGGDRQTLHEQLRCHAVEVRRQMLETGAENDLFERLERDPAFASVHGSLSQLREPDRFTGRARQQTVRYLTDVVAPVLEREHDHFPGDNEGTRV